VNKNRSQCTGTSVRFRLCEIGEVEGNLRESQVEDCVAEMPKNDYRSNDRGFT